MQWMGASELEVKKDTLRKLYRIQYLLQSTHISDGRWYPIVQVDTHAETTKPLVTWHQFSCWGMQALIHLQLIAFDHERHKDPIYVIPLASDGTTGLISYVKNQDGEGLSYVHTLNSASGFKRKLEAINVTLSAAYLVGRRERWTSFGIIHPKRGFTFPFGSWRKCHIPHHG